MKNNLESAWYNKDILPNEMKMRINGKKSWPKLENSWHFQYLDEAIKVCGKIETLIDLGCGGAEVGRVYPHIKYVGYDLEHIIKEVAQKINPTLSYEYFDAFKSNFNFCKKIDIILTNSFITELNNCTEILGKILEKAENYVVIHRQKFEGDEKLDNYKTYGGLNTIECTVSQKEFNEMIKNKFDIIYNTTYNDNMKTLTLKKI